MEPPPPRGDGLPPVPPNGDALPPGGDDGDGEDRLRATLQEFFTGVTRRLDEQMEARVADLRKEVDLAQVVKQTAELLGPKISSEVQGIVNEVNTRLTQMERAVETVRQGAGGQGQGNTVAVAQVNGKGKAEGFLVTAQTLVDYGVEKLWPLVQQNQMMKLMGMRDMAWAQQLKVSNPMMAQMLANTLAPDQLTNMMAMTIPNIAANAMAQGMRARALAQALAANPSGGGTWPGTPLPGSPGSLPTPGGMPIGSMPGQPGPSSGVSMAQKPGPRPKPKLKPRSGVSLKEPGPRDTVLDNRRQPRPSLRDVLG